MTKATYELVVWFDEKEDSAEAIARGISNDLDCIGWSVTVELKKDEPILEKED